MTEISPETKVRRRRGLSVAIFPMNLGGSNGARLELEAIFVPPYNAGRYGITMTSSPKQADIIFLLGSGTPKTLEYALPLLESLPDEVKLVVLGSDGAFSPSSNLSHTSSLQGKGSTTEEGVKQLPPGKTIAAYLTGAPPEPQAIINLILELAD